MKKPDRKLERAKMKRLIVYTISFSLLMSSVALVVYKTFLASVVSFFSTAVLIVLYVHFKKSLSKSARVKKLEEVFPDFLQLMSSNLKAGMTIDRAMLLSSRSEFSPLDEEILKTGKDIATGIDIEKAFLDMAERIGSEKIKKVILLIISGIRAGGDLAVLLEETSTNMRQRELLEKKAASNVMMYIIFIFVAVSLAAPALFSLSTVLVEIMSKLFAELPAMEASANLPFSISKINISIPFIKYFSVLFIIVIDILASLILGLINKGDEKQGLKYLPFIVAISLAVFFLARIFISNFMGDLF
jgi:archaeal flagellar protein FlaJ